MLNLLILIQVGVSGILLIQRLALRVEQVKWLGYSLSDNYYLRQQKLKVQNYYMGDYFWVI